MSSVLISRNGGAQTRIGGAQAAKESNSSDAIRERSYSADSDHIFGFGVVW